MTVELVDALEAERGAALGVLLLVAAAQLGALVGVVAALPLDVPQGAVARTIAELLASSQRFASHESLCAAGASSSTGPAPVSSSLRWQLWQV